MSSKEKVIPGCGNCDSFTSVCAVMFERGVPKPTLAKEALINPPGAIEGPISQGVPGLVCTAAREPELQKDCSHFIVRTEADNLRDENI